MLVRVPEGFGVTLLGKEILPSRSAKDLGVIVDSRLSFDEHVTEHVRLYLSVRVACAKSIV